MMNQYIAIHIMLHSVHYFKEDLRFLKEIIQQ